MISSTGLLGRCTISAVHRIASENDGALYRIQGVALPVGFIINHFAYGILEDRSKKLVSLILSMIWNGRFNEKIIYFSESSQIPS